MRDDVYSMNNSCKDKYRELCKVEKGIAIFQQDWWLDATCGDGWDVIIYEKGDKVLAALPYSINKVRGCFTELGLPYLTQFLGPWIKYPDNIKYEKKLSFDKEVLYSIIDNLPKTDSFVQKFSYKVTNWLPFYWRGFSATPLYTYVIEDLSNLNDLYNEKFSKNLRRDIRIASSHVIVEETDDLKLFYDLVSMTFRRQDMDVPYSFSFLHRLDEAIKLHAGRKLLIACDKERNVHAGVYIVWDDNSAYYLIGGEDTQWRQSQAMSLLLWEAIKFSATVSRRFDFEGSNIEPIEQFFKKYGAEQKVYFRVFKHNGKMFSALLNIIQLLKLLLRKNG